MSSPTISFLIPTHRPDRPLKRCLDSLDYQLGPDDEVLVIGDTADGPMPAVAELVATYGSRYRYLDHNTGRHTHGHAQLNYGIAQASKEWLHCNDDDDVWTPWAVDAIRISAEANPGKPLLFRFRSYHGGQIFWVEKGLFAYERIGGHCLPAGETIITERGFVPIEEVQRGDWVLTHEGRFRRVTEVMSREHADPLVRVQSAGMFIPTQTTTEHPFLVHSTRNERWKTTVTKEQEWIPAGQLERRRGNATSSDTVRTIVPSIREVREMEYISVSYMATDRSKPTRRGQVCNRNYLPQPLDCRRVH